MAETFSLSDKAHVYGSAVVRGVPKAEPGLPGGHFDVDIFDAPTNKEKYHEHKYDDKYDVTYVNTVDRFCRMNRRF